MHIVSVSKELEQLYLDNTPRIVNWVIKHNLKAVKFFDTIEDMRQILLLKLWMVLPKYDCNKSKFSTFAIICCTNEIKRVIRANNTQKRKGELISISEEITNEGLTLQDMLFQDEDILEEVVKQDIIQNSIPMLGPEAFEYFINLKTQKQIALENNISQTTVCRKIHKNLEVIRTSIES